MEICIRYGGREHCFVVPVLAFPVVWQRPGPGPVNYTELVQDAAIVAAIQDLAAHAADANLREALHRGIEAGIAAMQQHAGPDVTIRARGAQG